MIFLAVNEMDILKLLRAYWTVFWFFKTLCAHKWKAAIKYKKIHLDLLLLLFDYLFLIWILTNQILDWRNLV